MVKRTLDHLPRIRTSRKNFIQFQAGEQRFNDAASHISYCCRQGTVQRQEQERIRQSEYHALLETEVDSNAMDHDQFHETKVRYWSDYSRVFFDPKSIQPVPDALGIVEGDWMTNHELFRRYDGVCVLSHSLTFLITFRSEYRIDGGPTTSPDRGV